MTNSWFRVTMIRDIINHPKESVPSLWVIFSHFLTEVAYFFPSFSYLFERNIFFVNLATQLSQQVIQWRGRECNQLRALSFKDQRNNLRRENSLGIPFGPSDVTTSSNSLRCLPGSSSSLPLKAFSYKILISLPSN